jgi:hypothetical protein
MSSPCPKCGYVRKPSDAELNPLICPACGIAYNKWLARQKGVVPQHARVSRSIDEDEKSSFQNILEAITYVPEHVEIIEFYARAITFIGLLIWGFKFIIGGIDWELIMGSFMHNINLPFHEFGHVLFMPFGKFMHILGGSLFQVALPFGLMLAFIFQRRDNFAASVMLWWTGQSFIDVSPYIADANYRMLPLVGGASEEFHDWGNLLTMMNMLSSARKIANVSFGIGTLLILLSFVWGAYILYRQRKNIGQVAVDVK